MPSPKYRREMPQRYRLEAAKCKKCGKVFFPPRLICDKCKSEEFEKITLPENGKIVTFTIIRVAPQQFETEVPYAIAIVELENGVRLTTQVVDCNPEKLKIGNEIKLVFRKIQEEGKTGIIKYGYKAVLA
ncbi:MAG: Zn-ribbon domain-containing OB-fold protein [Candidatus Cloacimonetes bacterium]|nr:Zn-ribbon domain-containing OB-fold protein [Candidatus Cloacimonadota bacterium]MBL7108157.1 Zn-ribbon domain-containing OB-fold protein [Candidatus Cloacimonadota bacterium]